MCSTSSDFARRAPQQKRAARRRSDILEAAADLIVEVGYDLTNMKAVAKRAGASIGALYDYFPDKQSIAFSLLNQYAQEIENHWKPLVEGAAEYSHSEFADKFIQQFVDFVSRRPAYLPLLAASTGYSRDPGARKAIRVAFAHSFQAKNPDLTEEQAFLAANITLQMVKGLTALYAESDSKRRAQVTEGFKRILSLYFADLFGRERAAAKKTTNRKVQKSSKGKATR